MEPAADKTPGSLTEALREGFARCRMVRDDTGRVTDYVIAEANRAYLKGLGGATALGRRLLELRPEVSQAWFDTCARVLASNKPNRFEYWDPTARRWYDVRMTPVSPDELIMLYIDATPRKAEEVRQQERFRELNHRVKNNLNVVSAMLALQAKRAEPAVRDALEQAAARVHAISEVHTLLYRAGSIDSVNLETYLQELCSRLQRSLAAEKVRILHQSEPIDVAIEVAVQLGVIVNELVTNALKYAYPEGEAGDIIVKSERRADRLLLSVRDFGPGLPAGETKGLGLQLVRSLVQQAHGELTFQDGPGANICIDMPLAEAEFEQDTLL